MNWKHWCLMLVCAGFLAVGCGDDDNPTDPGDGDGNGNGNGNGTPTLTPPREWQGTWAGTTTTIDVTTLKAGAVADTTEDTDTLTICDKGITGGEVPFGCVYFIGEDSIDVDCDTILVFAEGGDTCTFDATIVATGKRTGTSFTISGRQTTIGTGAACDPDDTEDVMLTATYTRINSTVPECGDDIPEDTTDTGGGNTGEFVSIGDYESRVRVWICGDNTPVTDTRDTSSICPGDSPDDFDDDFEQAGITCDIDIGESTISVTCNGVINDAETGCTITTTNSYNGTFDDDSYDMTGGGTISASGAGEFCGFIPDQCFEFEVNGRRLNSSPSDCPGKSAPGAAAGLDPALIAELVKSKVQAALESAALQNR